MHVTFKDAVEMFKDDIKISKEHIYIQRMHVNTYHEIKASLSENDLMLHVDFAESCKNDQQDAIQSAYFGNQCFRIFTACSYAKSPNNNDVRNDVIVTKKFRPRESRVYELPAKCCPRDQTYAWKNVQKCLSLEWWNWVTIYILLYIQIISQ